MADTALYVTSPVKRTRASRADMDARAEALLAIVAQDQPMTVRQAFYQATVRGIVEKAETGYAKVQRALARLRQSGRLPWHWIADNTRWQRKPRTYAGMEAALHETANLYRRDLWRDADAYVEIWLEKDALAGVIQPVTSRYDVPLMVARGYASLSFLYEAGQAMAHEGRPCHVYHFGDFDPSGVNAADSIESSLRRFAPGAEISFERVAVTEAMIARWNLPTRPTKRTDSRAAGFGPVSVELDAIAPEILRALVEDCINDHLPSERLAALEKVEAMERETLRQYAGKFAGGRADE